MSKTALPTVIALLTVVGCQGTKAQTPIPPSAQDFVLAASQSDQYEILAAQLAKVQAQNARVRDFAEEMIQDHTRLAKDLAQAAMMSGLQVPKPGMSSDQAALLSGLQGLRGVDFDKSYARQQVLAHTQAAAVEDSFATAGDDAALRKAAQTALPTIRDHLKMAQQLRADLGGS